MSARSPRQKAAASQPLAHLVVATPDAEHDLLAQLLVGEMALSRNDLKTASTAYGKAAVLSQDPEVPSAPPDLPLRCMTTTARKVR